MNTAKTTDLFSELSPPFSDEHDLKLLSEEDDLTEWDDESTSFFTRPIPLTEQRGNDAREGEEVSRVVDVDRSRPVGGSATTSASPTVILGMADTPVQERGVLSSRTVTAVMAGLVLAAATWGAVVALRASEGPEAHPIKSGSELAPLLGASEPVTVDGPGLAPAPTLPNQAAATSSASGSVAPTPSLAAPRGSDQTRSAATLDESAPRRSARTSRGSGAWSPRPTRAPTLPTPTRYENGSFRRAL